MRGGESGLISVGAAVAGVLVAGALAGCGAGGAGAADGPALDGGAPAAPITALVGEVHLHQFPLGSHAWAAFDQVPVPVAEVTTDTLHEIEPTPTLVEGPCALYQTPACSPVCAPGTYCASTNRCAPLEPVLDVDDGPVDVQGSQLWPDIRLTFSSVTSPYVSVPAPGDVQLFAGGERLAYRGGEGALAFAGTVVAPREVIVTAPDLTQPLRFPTAAPLAIAWVGEGADEIVVFLHASQESGTTAYVRCVTADVGTLDVPADIMAALPPPPRSIRLEVERDEQRIAATETSGLGVLVHVAQSTWKNDME